MLPETEDPNFLAKQNLIAPEFRSRKFLITQDTSFPVWIEFMGYARWVVFDDKDVSGLLLEQKDT